MKIGFIGLGNMATAIIGGLLREGTTLSSEDDNATVITARPRPRPRDRSAPSNSASPSLPATAKLPKRPMCWCSP